MSNIDKLNVNDLNEVNIFGKCVKYPRDKYNISISEYAMRVEFSDYDFDEHVTMVFNQEDAIKIAETILNFYKGGK